MEALGVTFICLAVLFGLLVLVIGAFLLRRYQLRALRTGKREAAEWAFRERARALAEAGIPDAVPEPS